MFYGQVSISDGEDGWCGCGLELSTNAAEYCCTELDLDARQDALTMTLDIAGFVVVLVQALGITGPLSTFNAFRSLQTR